MNRYVCLWIVFHICFWQHVPKLVFWIFYALSDMVSDIPWTSTWSGVRILNLSGLFVCFNLLWLKSCHHLHQWSRWLLPVLWNGKAVPFSVFHGTGFSVDENQNLPAYGFNRLYELTTCSAAYLRCCISLNSNSDKHKERKCLLL